MTPLASLRLTRRLVSVGALVAATSLLTAPLRGSLVFQSDFSGGSGSSWGWTSVNDASGQFGGSTSLVITNPPTKATSWLSQPVTSHSVVNPDGTGFMIFDLVVDVSNYPTGTADFTGKTIFEVHTASGNKSAFDGSGRLVQLNISGFNNPGELRFGVGHAMNFGNNAGSSTGVMNVGNATPNRIYAISITTTLSKVDTAWTVSSVMNVTGPVDNVGTIGTLSVTDSYSATPAGTFNGWLSVDAYRAGITAAGGNAMVEGSGITLVSFAAVPEPASFGLAAALLGAILVLRRRRSR